MKYNGNVQTILNNLDHTRVIWLMGSGVTDLTQPDPGLLDLHSVNGGNFAGQIFNTALSRDATILGDVTFKGSVYASGMKFGTDISFTGSSVPEPSSVILFSGLMLASLSLHRRRVGNR